MPLIQKILLSFAQKISLTFVCLSAVFLLGISLVASGVLTQLYRVQTEVRLEYECREVADALGSLSWTGEPWAVAFVPLHKMVSRPMLWPWNTAPT